MAASTVSLERDRDQLWAEAVHRYKACDKWGLETPELEALAEVEMSGNTSTSAMRLSMTACTVLTSQRKAKIRYE